MQERLVDSLSKPRDVKFASRLAGTILDFVAFGGMCLALEKLHAQPVLSGPMALAVFSLVTGGMTHVLVHSPITHPIAQLAGMVPVIGKGLYDESDGTPRGLLACPVCTGMWAGALVAGAGFEAWSGFRAIDFTAHGLIGAVAAGLLSRVLPK